MIGKQAATPSDPWPRIDESLSKANALGRLSELRRFKNLQVSHNDPMSVAVAYAAYTTMREKELLEALKQLAQRNDTDRKPSTTSKNATKTQPEEER